MWLRLLSRPALVPAMRASNMLMGHGLSSVMPVGRRGLLVGYGSKRSIGINAWGRKMSSEVKNDEETEQKEEATTNAEPSAELEPDGAEELPEAAEAFSKEIQELAEKLKEREEAVKQLTEQKIRFLADMENTRMIAKRDVANANQYGISKFAKSLLEVADNLTRALGAIPDEQLNDGDKHLKELYKGVEMTRKELMKVFEAYDIKEFGGEGDAFDPNLHLALFEAAVPGKKEGLVISVTKKGYMISDRVLRAAEVGVSKEA